METDARGQLGGYDTTDAVRRRYASESPSYKCPACGKTNAEIIRESEELAKQTSSTSAQDVQVPEELNMGFRDEMEAAAARNKEQQQQQADEDAETAELAEGFVQTVPSPPPGSAPPTNTADQGARPAQSVPQPTRTTVEAPPVPRQAVSGTARRPADEGVPMWLDRMIVGLVILLAALLLKVLFAA